MSTGVPHIFLVMKSEACSQDQSPADQDAGCIQTAYQLPASGQVAHAEPEPVDDEVLLGDLAQRGPADARLLVGNALQGAPDVRWDVQW